MGSPSTAAAEQPSSRLRAYRRLAGLIALFLVCAPIHVVMRRFVLGGAQDPETNVARPELNDPSAPPIDAAHITGVYLRKDDWLRALADSDEALRLDPKDVMAHVNRGRAFGMRGDFDKAVASFDEALRLDPKSAEARRSRGMTYADQGDYHKAQSDCDEAVRFAPKSARAFADRGHAYGIDRYFETALADFTSLVQRGDCSQRSPPRLRDFAQQVLRARR